MFVFCICKQRETPLRPLQEAMNTVVLFNKQDNKQLVFTLEIKTIPLSPWSQKKKKRLNRSCWSVVLYTSNQNYIIYIIFGCKNYIITLQIFKTLNLQYGNC